jgi:hypothetical protein
MTKLSVSKLVNARSVFESWVALSALDVLDIFTTVICYCNETCSLALVLNIKFLVYINYDYLIPLYNTKVLRFVICIRRSRTKVETCQGGLKKSNGNLSWAQVKKRSWKRGGRNGQIRPLPLDGFNMQWACT